jgi:uncharacterized cupredoxin-like copper-binding protein
LNFDLLKGKNMKATFLLALALLGSPAYAHGPEGHGQRHAGGNYKVTQMPFGIAGDKAKAKRTVFVSLGDDMRFSPSRIEVRQGEVIRFVFRNKGKLLHEWVLGSDQELKDHAEMMRKHPDMDHDEIHMVHVPPGKTDELIWHFNRAGSFGFACLVAGHYEAGMAGTVVVTPPAH